MTKPCNLCRTRTTESRHCAECRTLIHAAQSPVNAFNALASLRKAQTITEVLAEVGATADQIAVMPDSAWKLISRVALVNEPSAWTKTLVAALLPAGTPA